MIQTNTERMKHISDHSPNRQFDRRIIFAPSLIEAFNRAGIAYPDQNPCPGKLVRFATNGRKNDKAGWCRVFPDQDGAIFGDWRANVEYVWQRGRAGSRADTDQLAAIRQLAHESKRLIEAERQASYAKAAKMATETWENALQISSHPYLTSKRIKPHIARERMGQLIIPVLGNDNSIQSLQFIEASGTKRFMSGGKMQGGRCWIGKSDTTKPILITEGFATAASLHEATGWPVCISFSAGNLQRVASDVRIQFPKASIMICGDDDRDKNVNIGRTKAIEAANAIDAVAVFPVFKNDTGSDFNDMSAQYGLEAIRAHVVSALSMRPIDDDPEREPWSDPQPIPNELLPVIPFDYSLLPVSIRQWVSDISERMQCPPDFVAAGAMVVLSSVIGRKACIAPKRVDNWRVIPNLWAVIVGRPGVMKSPALSEVMKPIERLEAIANEQHAEAVCEYSILAQIDELAEKDAKAKAQKLVSAGKVDEATRLLAASAEHAAKPPALRRYKVNDTTVEALGEILIENPNGVLCYRDELHGLLRSLDKEGQEGARAFYLQAYDGNQGYTFDRITRGRNLHIPAVCASMLGGIQPGKLQSYIHHAVKGGAGDDGLLQRFGLLVWPDINPAWRNVDRQPDANAKSEALKTLSRLDALQCSTDIETGETTPTEYRFTPEAQAEFDEWRESFEKTLRRGEHHPAIESHLSKYRKLVPALALVCALADGEEVVSLDSLLRALAWAEYLQSHAMRAYAAGTRIQTDSAKALLDKILDGKLTDGFTQRDVYLKGWALLNDKGEVREATEMLCDLGYLRMIQHAPGPSGGRPSFSFEINPKIRTGGQ